MKLLRLSAPAPVSPFSASISAFSPGIPMGMESLQNDAHKKMLIALIVCSSLAAIIVVSLCFWIFHRRYKYKYQKRSFRSSDAEKGLVGLAPILRKFSSNKMVASKISVPMIDYEILEKGTDVFQESNVLGEGGFGRVYKAQLDNNLLVAVKKLECRDKDSEREFETEVDLLSKIQHSNIIRLLGYSIHGESRLLVYELMENGSLETLLFCS